jgi:hypothetical protein
MNLLCCILGHKWSNGEFQKNCKRNKCLASKTLMEYPYRGQYGQSEFKWEEKSDSFFRFRLK